MKRLTQSMVAKVAAFVLLILTAAMTLLAAFGGIILVDQSFFLRPEQSINHALQRVGYEDAYSIFHRYLSETQSNGSPKQDPSTYLQPSNVTFEIRTDDGSLVAGTYTGQQTPYSFRYQFQSGEVLGYGSEYEYVDGVYQGPEEKNPATMYDVIFYLDPTFSVQDNYKATFEWIYWGITTLKDIGYGIFAIAALSALSALFCFVFLLCSAGHRAGRDGIVAGPLVRKVPFDLLTAAVFALGACPLFLGFGGFYGSSDLLTILSMSLCGLAVLILGTFYCMNFAVRVKLGKWWENTLLFRVGRFCLSWCKRMLRKLSWLIQRIPLVWKTAVFCGIFALSSLVTVLLWSDGVRATFWLFGMVLLLPAFLYIALMLRSLLAGSRALASGDLSYQVDTKQMVWEFKEAGENLNQISNGMALAVEERLKSERFKTELITNVSHDIKTPLTSIINYADLIAKEEGISDTLKEYSAVLLRQSDRLKKLLEDLVEASKASTGNLEVHLAPCELGVLLTQTAGEYEQKLAERSLQLIVKGDEMPIRILADGKLLWRVFDNLMTNALKYAQSGTRVYLTLEKQDSSVLISFKNTSSYALDLPAEELLERFARGDASRHTDGNGLGLSIAQSLTELQGGTLSLTVDGDLFKVNLRFQTIA